jgi:GAF domain-containing protein
MNDFSKKARYARIYKQLEKLFEGCSDPQARMASICALLHHKMKGFFWTGFYLIKNGELIVSSYQGPLACMMLKKDKGVCWAGINTENPVIVPDVEKFPGHIACDSRSKSEIVVPLKNKNGEIIGVLDVDSTSLDNFDNTDAVELANIIKLVYNN